MTGPQINALHNNEVDLGFIIPPSPDAGKLQVEIIHTNRLIAAVPEKHRLSRHKRVKLADMVSEPWVSYPPRQGPGLHERIVAACRVAGFAPSVTQEALQMDTIVNLVAGGMGVALVSRALSTGSRRGVIFRELSGVGAPVNYELAIAYGASTPALDAFVRAALATRKEV